MSVVKKVLVVAFDKAVKVGKTEYTYLNANEHKMDITLDEGYVYLRSLFDGSHSVCPVQMVKWFVFEDANKKTEKTTDKQ
jgi:hypothetical protein